MEENKSPYIFDIDDESEETLSLSDLPLHGGDGVEDFSNSSSSSSEQDCFEFFSEVWSSPSSASSPPENIVFCGKLIPYKQPISGDDTPDSGGYRKNYSGGRRDRRSRNNGSELNLLPSSKSQSVPVSPGHRRSAGNRRGTHDFRAKQASILTAAPLKCRWYFLMFGLARIPMEMEWRDIKSRQGRHNSTSFGGKSGDGKQTGFSKSRRKGWWGLIGALGCGGSRHATAVAKASLGGFPCV